MVDRASAAILNAMDDGKRIAMASITNPRVQSAGPVCISMRADLPVLPEKNTEANDQPAASKAVM